MVNRHLRTVPDKHGPAMAKLCRTVLSGMAGLATRHDALEHNPVRDAGRIVPSGSQGLSDLALGAVSIHRS
jgi:hypothetical protein